MMGVEEEEPEYVIVLANEDNIKVLEGNGDLITEASITEGVFIADDFLAIKNMDSIYVGIEVFNDTYRGKGIMHVNTKDVVIKPIYEEIHNYGYSIQLSGDDMKSETIIDYNFPINDKTSKINKGFVSALSNNIYLVSKDEEMVAIYNVAKKEVITKYEFVKDSDYPKIKTINKNQYIFLLDENGSYSVITEHGEILVSSSKEEIEVRDIYQNKKYYFVTEEGYYALDGTKYFK